MKKTIHLGKLQPSGQTAFAKTCKLVRGQKGQIAFLQHVCAGGTIWEGFPLNTSRADAGGQQVSLGLTGGLAGETVLVRMAPSRREANMRINCVVAPRLKRLLSSAVSVPFHPP